MESVNKPSAGSYVSECIKVKDFIGKWLEAINTEIGTRSSDDQECQECIGEIGDILPIPNELMDELTEICGPQSLDCKCEAAPDKYPYTKKSRSWDAIKGVPKDLDLMTIKLQKQQLDKRWSSKYARTSFIHRAKHRFFYSQLVQPFVGLPAPKPHDEVIFPDAAISLIVYRPFCAGAARKMPKVEQKMMVLGCQFLTELRDRIFCVSDLVISDDHSECPDIPQTTRAKDLYKSGFFFINGVFYNDMRDPMNHNNSKVIMDWANSDPKRNVGPFQTKLMEDTKFCDLEIRLGYPYVYQHQGNCEHMLIFTDLRLLDQNDCQDRTQYPLILAVASKRCNLCMVCNVFTAKWVTKNNNSLPHDPFYFCDSCFRKFNYTADGKKLGEFMAFPYFDRSVLL